MGRNLTSMSVRKELEMIKLSKKASRCEMVTVLKYGTDCLL